MLAALVTSFDEPPHACSVPAPGPAGPGQLALEVVAVGLHPRVRSGAAGKHYTSEGVLPLVPGIDGVGRRADGRLVYFVTDDDARGSLAQRVIVDARRTVELPAGVDPLVIAAAMNPAMSSWVALRRRVPLIDGARVLVLGATGNAGTAACRIARRLGAGEVVAAGRDESRLVAADVDVHVQLTSDADETAAALAAAAAEVDIVLDYLWGLPAQRAMTAILTARPDRSRALDWVQIGAVAGPTLELASVLLRSANLRLLGNGQGAVSPAGYAAELPSLVAEIAGGLLPITARPVPLTDVERVWDEAEHPGERVVFQPSR
ncbi:zinc-binding alcohol dehydrogenase family protein [uncultured Jatrophihabitans sp.]|uniref:zinc-binding alcohol dehydrogenase family protein n=1 Tax=uncultured Jatrophihabitans sp. TaxID=1610747 RepID=UPI0035C9E3F0